MGAAVDAVRPHLPAAKQTATKEVLRKPACHGWGPQIVKKMLVSDATESVKCIGARPRLIESP
jgi:hypothetical protein